MWGTINLLQGTGTRYRASRYLPGLGALLAGALVTALISGCGSPGKRATPAPVTARPATTVPAATSATAGTALTASTTTAAPTTTATTRPAPPAPTAPATAAPATFSYGISGPLDAAQLPYSWRPGCPVGPDQLRQVSLDFWGFDGAVHHGVIVVNAAVAAGVIKVFATLFAERFPLAEVVPVDAYRGSDDAAAAADDTSGFNCRDAVTSGPPQWSVHAYGEAIDVNDVQNPYVYGSTVIPPAGVAYTDRADLRPGMAVPGGQLVDAFAAVGWQWGGRWTATPDYQHFSLTGG